MSDTVVVNGRQIGPSSDLAELLRRQIKSGTALGQMPDEGPETAIFALFNASRGTALEHRLVDTATGFLTDPDPDIRRGAVEIVQQFPEMFDPVALVEVLESQPRMFRDVPGGANKPDLANGLLRAAAAHPSSDDRVINRLREAAVDPRNGGWVLAGVATNDTDWVLQHVPEVVNGDANRAQILLFRLKDPVLRERLVREIPRESPQLRKLLSEAVTREIQDPSERDRLNNLLK
jgi:hypothetical protein